ncbi:hypothetical protein BLNAU_17592 [Blattamonas nauphoetae]|uniref:Uncharacterized protein n=1 Tax=Blattamonas nauphoetae TaxID=2049346 RepID=A0ABQ9X6V2_9EUKA|nr:hypothetical protein BLNAU_17592 [Blattamonas nauphoetae]
MEGAEKKEKWKVNEDEVGIRKEKQKEQDRKDTKDILWSSSSTFSRIFKYHLRRPHLTHPSPASHSSVARISFIRRPHLIHPSPASHSSVARISFIRRPHLTHPSPASHSSVARISFIRRPHLTHPSPASHSSVARISLIRRPPRSHCLPCPPRSLLLYFVSLPALLLQFHHFHCPPQTEHVYTLHSVLFADLFHWEPTPNGTDRMKKAGYEWMRKKTTSRKEPKTIHISRQAKITRYPRTI